MHLQGRARRSWRGHLQQVHPRQDARWPSSCERAPMSCPSGRGKLSGSCACCSSRPKRLSLPSSFLMRLMALLRSASFDHNCGGANPAVARQTGNCMLICPFRFHHPLEQPCAILLHGAGRLPSHNCSDPVYPYFWREDRGLSCEGAPVYIQIYILICHIESRVSERSVSAAIAISKVPRY